MKYVDELLNVCETLSDVSDLRYNGIGIVMKGREWSMVSSAVKRLG